ncbi:T9SS type A sorting domain-containing protein [Pedobacter sp. SL55]|uniref:T9SS type A sorting domain-containing protein n=1 Tax=Pedobacter sp. SL55 TaxID=2995161 RepID=UPI002270A5A2|nr:T9SS type A sorting domain-containing protein [Pedobacter sp. SL55]WAC40263.1 T9SS type A sorting domain-containing protein [Pedobacter sp. SL55]
MRQKLLLLFLSLLGVNQLQAQVVNIPDANFKAALLAHSPKIDLNNDGQIQVSEAEAVNGRISIFDKNIADLTGIEAFVNVTELFCNRNKLTSIDISKNTAIINLICDNNQLSALDISKNTALKALNCTRNQLSTLDVSQNTALTSLLCSSNIGIRALDINKNILLEGLACSSTSLEVLDVSNCTKLTSLQCFGTKIKTLDVSQCPNLVVLSCNTNLELEKLNIKNGNNTSFIRMLAYDNPKLTCIQVDDVAYSNAQSDMSSWAKDVTATYNTDCRPVVNIPDPNFKAALLAHNPKIDADDDGKIQVSEAEAFTGTINVIRKNITSLAGIEAFVNITRLLCSNNNLTSLDVSKNTAIAALGCDNNQLTALDLSKNTALTSIGCINNRLTSLDITKNIALTSLSCYNNQLATLDVSQNALLTGFNFSSNPIQVIDMDNCKQLTNLRCSATKIKTLDVSQFPNLLALECYSNSELENLNIKNGNNTAFSRMLAHENPKLTCIQVDDVAYSNAQTIDMFSRWTKDATATYNTDCRPVVNIPDANFKAYLLGNATINTDGDTEIQVEEAEAFTGTINCNHRNITDLTGIEAFVNITALLANNNQLTELNVTKNTALKFLFCENNQLKSLDVTQNIALEMMYCNSNKITSLDLKNNTVLNALLCDDNLLTDLDVSKNTALMRLICGKNPISSLDISNNIALTQLFCENSAKLSSLNLKNGKNDILYLVIANQNPKLFCIEVDDVDQANTYTTNGGWKKDASANYKTNCNEPVVYIPDANFKAYLLARADINTNGDAEIQFAEAEAFDRNFDMYDLGINDLTGIEAFINLKGLNCKKNNLTSLDLTKNTKLANLDCEENQLTTLDLSQNTELIFVYCSANKLTDIDVSQSPALISLGVNDNQLTNLDVSGNPALVGLSCGENLITSLDLSNNPALSSLDCNDNKLTSLDLSSNTNLGVVSCNNNELTSINLTQNQNLTILKCYGNELAVLDLSNNNALLTLDCHDNLLTALDLVANTRLMWLNCSFNQILKLDLTKNSMLNALYCEHNSLLVLDLKNENNYELAELNATVNPNLSCIQVDDVSAAIENTNWQKDNSANYNENCNYTLPVTLVEFKASATGNSAKLEWSTASEQRNRGFVIYRSGDDGKSVKIAEIPPAVQRQGANYNYSYIDRMPLNGNNYYELQQLDDDGKINNLGVRNVSFNLTDQRVTFYPNPTSDWVDINFKGKNFNSLWVFDMSGKLLFSKAIGTTESSARISLNNVAAGTYVLRLRGELHQETIKVVKK